ncbi:hypothetical protein JCM14036_01640 [Desulfotomaculum defluvii]
MMDYLTLVKRAIEKDQDAWSEIYNRTSNMIYFTSYSILKNKEDALDVMQSSYITAFSKIGQLKEAASFEAWLKRITVNNCKNLYKKKMPNLLWTNENDAMTLNNMEEQREDFLPEDYIVNQTKRQQIMEIINRLPDAQRITVLLFYYDELSVKEIAQITECSESTVTSRISYAKKHIKSEVETLEKRGDKLYAAAPVPFLARLFAEEAKATQVSLQDSASVWQQILSSIHESSISAALQSGVQSTTSAQQSISGMKGNLISRIAGGFAKLSAPAKIVLVGAVSVGIMVATVAMALGEKASNLTAVQAVETKVEEHQPALGVLVDKVYDNAGYFRDGVCPVNVHGKWGVIDTVGKFIMEPQWDYMSLCSQDGYLMVGNYLGETESGEGTYIECGFIDIKGTTVVPMQKSIVEPAMVFLIDAKYLGNDAFSIYTYDRGLIYYDNGGNEIPPVTTEYAPELQYITIKEEKGDEHQWGIADKEGNVIIRPQYTMAFSMGGGFFVVNEGGPVGEFAQGGTWKIINEKNELVMDLGSDSFYYVQGEPGHGWGESFPLHTPMGTLIVGAVEKKNEGGQKLLEQYTNLTRTEFQSITASSSLSPAASHTYGPQNVADGNDLTAWVEGVKGNGENQWLQLSGDGKAPIKTIVISNGYCSNKETYLKNSRVKEMELEFSDGTSHVVKLPDSMYEYTLVNLPQEVSTTSVKCTILSVYPGEKYTDTCINEIAFFGEKVAGRENGGTHPLANSAHSDSRGTQANAKEGKTPTAALMGDPKMYAAYYEILQKRIDEYGTLPPGLYDAGVNLAAINGVAFATVLNFDENSTEELLIFYNNKESNGSPYSYEVWGYNGSAHLIAKEQVNAYGGGRDEWCHLEVYKQAKNSYVVNDLFHKVYEDRFQDRDSYHAENHYTYSTIVNNKWITKELHHSSENYYSWNDNGLEEKKRDPSEYENRPIPWEGAECIFSFDAYYYSDEYAEQLQKVLNELKKYKS